MYQGEGCGAASWWLAVLLSVVDCFRADQRFQADRSMPSSSVGNRMFFAYVGSAKELQLEEAASRHGLLLMLPDNMKYG